MYHRLHVTLATCNIGYIENQKLKGKKMNSIPEAMSLTPVIFHYPEPILKQQTDELLSISEKIESVSKNSFSRIASLTMKHVRAAFTQQTYSLSAVKIAASSTYLGLLGLGFLTSYASINLLYNSSISSALSPDVETRVDYANTVTNSGALFSCLTDLPAITYSLYLLVMKNAYRKAVHELSDEGYHSCINEQAPILTPEMREELYQEHISKLQSFGVEDYYLRPDPLSQTGALHAALAPKLKAIDLQIKEGVTIRALWKNCIGTSKQESCTRKLVTATLGAVGTISLLCTAALATFIILENGILIRDTPVKDLFSRNSTDQLNEAFYLTQLGNVFCSLTIFAATTYVSYLQFLRTAYKKTMREKICASFADHFSDLSSSMSFALHRIRKIKLKNA